MKQLGIFLTALILLTFASAEVTYYNLDSGDDIRYKETISRTYVDWGHDFAVTKTTYAYYDNDDRHSTDDYRHGYSYRKSKDYWNRRYDKLEGRYYRHDAYDDNKHRDYRYSRYDNDGRWHTARPVLQYRYNEYTDSYDYRDCYTHEPRGKLFYWKC
jgi:hypothetical protein